MQGVVIWRRTGFSISLKDAKAMPDVAASLASPQSEAPVELGRLESLAALICFQCF
ncbi:MAG TPA: hypothetical protein VNU44_24190 [Bryobacteraceae bacterium]|jgi:hypothetical protein|nr:hypothetical protein [Bryobacteraceae bacterium]